MCFKLTTQAPSNLQATRTQTALLYWAVVIFYMLWLRPTVQRHLRNEHITRQAVNSRRSIVCSTFLAWARDLSFRPFDPHLTWRSHVIWEHFCRAGLYYWLGAETCSFDLAASNFLLLVYKRPAKRQRRLSPAWKRQKRMVTWTQITFFTATVVSNDCRQIRH